MTRNEAIEQLRERLAITDYRQQIPEYYEAIELAIEALEKMKELEKGLEDLEDTLNDAYTLNDFCLNKVILNQQMSECECIAESFSLKAMQNLSWILGVIKGSDENEES